MADIFISYASEDRDKAGQLAKALEAKGWSLWWDRTILPGTEFDEVIEHELDAARSVIVIWSENSVSSRWVNAEAREALDAGKLVPVFLSDVKARLVFRSVQGADFTDWTSNKESVAYRQLVDALSAKLGPPPGKESGTQNEINVKSGRALTAAKNEVGEEVVRQSETNEQRNAGSAATAPGPSEHADKPKVVKSADPHTPRLLRGPWLWSGGLVLVVLVTAPLVWHLAGPPPVETSQVAQTAVPELNGRTLKDASAMLPIAGLRLGTVTRLASDDMDVGRVLSQTPQAGTHLEIDSVVDVVLSAGPPGMSIGSAGTDVEKVQKLLSGLGYYRGPIDGMFGPGTQVAVKVFQKDANLAVDGVIGPKLVEELERANIAGALR